jgi:hypothetical protein
MGLAGVAMSAPVVQQVSGTLNHKATITISGTAFGSKAVAAPLVWDDASGSSMSDKWDGQWPYKGPAGYNTGYYSPMRGVSPPHSHDTRFIAGAHNGDNWQTGADVVFFKNITLQTFPFYIYASWYQVADKNWVFGGDNNYKTFEYSVCCSPYENPNDWFTAYGPPHPGSTTDSPQWLYTDNGHSLLGPVDLNGHNAWWGHGISPMSGKWAKVEVAVKVTNATDGFIKVWENGQQVMDYVGSTDKYAGTSRTVGIGGFARIASPNNWRYFDDAYLDLSLAHVVLANNPVLADATVVENQIPSAWSNTSITATVNLGQFAAGSTAYLFVVDASGTPNATGVAVKAGGSGSESAPLPPSGIAVR